MIDNTNFQTQKLQISSLNQFKTAAIHAHMTRLLESHARSRRGLY